MRAVVIMLTVAAAATTFAKPAHNDPASKEMRAAFEEATTNYNLGHFEEALAAFERGYRVKNDPAFLFNIGQCQRQLGRPKDAARSYRAYLRESPSVPAEQSTEVQRLIGLMDEEVARAAANAPPTGVSPPADGAPAVAPPVAAPPANPLVETPPPAPKKKRTALWVGIGVGAGVVAAGLAIGLGVGLSQSGGSAPSSSLGNMSVSFK
jgi:tetratricopeptide repeat protein